MGMYSRRQTLKAAMGATGIGALAGCSALLGDNEDPEGRTETDLDEGDLDELPEIEITVGASSNRHRVSQNTRAVMTFREILSEATDGKITVDAQMESQLGDQRELIEQNINGTVEVVCSTSEGHLAPFYPNMNIIGAPYLFNDVDHALYTLDHYMGHMFEDFREQTGMRILAYYDNGGFRSFGTIPEIRGPDDLEGLRIRTMEIDAHQELVRQLGASPEPIAWSELYDATNQGVVDGQENSMPTVVAGNLQEVIDHIILDRHVFSMNFFHANEEWFQDLPEAYQQLVLEAGFWAGHDARMINRYRRNRSAGFMEEAGVEVYDPPPEVLDEFAERTQEPVLELVRDQIDNEELLNNFLDAADDAEDVLGFPDVIG